MSWDQRFFDPIKLPNGRELVTPRDAAQYIMKLPKAEQQATEWQTAIEMLMLVGEGGGGSAFQRRLMASSRMLASATGTNHPVANSARSPTRGPHYESKKSDNLGGFAGDAFGRHLDWLRYLDYDLRHSAFGERLYYRGYWCGAIPLD
jgi:hypothetical protein